MASFSDISNIMEEAYIAATRRFQKDNGKTKSDDLDSAIKKFREEIAGNSAMIEDFEKLSLDWNHVGRSLGSSPDVKMFKRGIDSAAFLASGDKKFMTAGTRTAVLIFAGLYMGITTKADLSRFVNGGNVAGIDVAKQKAILSLNTRKFKEKTYDRQAEVTLNPGGLFEILGIGRAWTRGNDDVSGLLNKNSPMTRKMKLLIEQASGVSLD